MGKPNFSAELPDATLRYIEELKPLYNGNKTQIVIQAIKLLYQQELRPMPLNHTLTEQQANSIARDIYTEIYGDIDNKYFKADKLAEISDWLLEGDPNLDYTDNEPLIAEWREIDAEEIEARNVQPPTRTAKGSGTLESLSAKGSATSSE